MTAIAERWGGMNQRMRGAKVRTINTKSLVMGVVMLACAPVFCNLIIATSTSALSLLQPVRDITAPVVNILQGKKESPPTQVVAEPLRQVIAPLTATNTPLPTIGSGSLASAEQPAPAAASSLQPAPDFGSTDAGSGVVADQPFDPLAPVDATLARPNQSSRVATLAVATRPAATTQSTFAGWLQTTPQGWQLFGLLWYWWLLVATGVYGVTTYGQKMVWLLTAKYGKVMSK